MINVLEKLRNKMFWFFDYAQLSKVKKHYDDIKFINKNFNSEKVKKIRRDHLEKVLEHAKSTTQYYKGIEDSKNLNQFPVVNKNIIRDNFKSFESSKYKNKPRYKVSTSGSTGTPFTTYLNKNKKIRNSADTIFFAEKSGFYLGNQLFYIRLWDDQHRKNSLTSWILNIISHNIFDLKDEDISKLLSKMEKSHSSKGLLAYASAYDAIGKYLDKKKSQPLDFNIKSIIAISERLSDYAKESMEKYFGVPVVSRYSASETGILAQQNIGSDNFDVNWASYVVEIIEVDSDSPTEYGKVGRIVITDLFNYSVPMIRYDTGDLGVMIIVDEKKCPVLAKVEGRKMDMIYNTKGELISSHIVHKICLYKGIIQYQLIQKGEKEYLFKINVTDEFEDEKKLIDTYKKYFGEDSILNIEYVDDIPILSSGKRKKVINLYIKDKVF